MEHPLICDMETEFKELDSKKGWAALYQQIRSESNQFDFPIKEAKKIENKNLNRYRDVSPYDHSRVKLGSAEVDYINASLLEVPDAHRAYILTQGPLPNTTAHFWQMVWEQRSRAVLMLNKVIEKNAVKCHQYWPLGSTHNGDDVMELEAAGLRVEYVGETEASYYTVRKLLLSHTKTEESRVVLHFHYTTWPDFSVPQSPSAFLHFLFAVRESGALDENMGPPVVHCSAGIGRSGTFCLVDSCLVLIENHQDLNAANIRRVLLDMRKYRMGLIQTHDQLRFSYLAVLEGAKRVLTPIATNNGREKCPKRSSSGYGENEEDGDSGDENDNTVDDDDEEEESLSRSSLDDTTASDALPLLPPKRARIECPPATAASPDAGSHKQNNVAVNQNNHHHHNHLQREVNHSPNCHQTAPPPPSPTTNNSAPPAEGDPVVDAGENCGDEGAPAADKAACMTMKDGAVVTNFGEKLREAELRKRQRKERNEKLRDRVQDMHRKQHESERRHDRPPYLKPILVSLLLLGSGYLVYRYFLKE